MSDIVDPNCIIRAFDNFSVTILSDEGAGKPMYWFRSSDVAKIIGVVHIHSSTQNYSAKEKEVRRVETAGGPQDVVFLSSRGVYRLLYNSRKPIAEKFREWVGDILDDIIFNQGKQLRAQLEQLQAMQERIAQLEEDKATIELKHKIETHNRLRKEFINKRVVYLAEIGDGLLKYGETSRWKARCKQHVGSRDTFYLLYVVEYDFPEDLEKRFEKHAEVAKRRVTRPYKDRTETEVIRVDENFTPEHCYNLLLKLRKNLLDEGDKDLHIERMKLKQEELKTEAQIQQTKACEAQLKIYEAQLQLRQRLSYQPTAPPAIQAEEQDNDNAPQAEANPNAMPKLPEFPDVDTLAGFYHAWQAVKPTYELYENTFTRMPWKKTFGDKHQAMKQRRSRTLDFLRFIDSLTPQQQTDVMRLFEQFMTEHNVAPSPFVKDVFYGMRPSVKGHRYPDLCAKLQELLELKGYKMSYPAL